MLVLDGLDSIYGHENTSKAMVPTASTPVLNWHSRLRHVPIDKFKRLVSSLSHALDLT